MQARQCGQLHGTVACLGASRGGMLPRFTLLVGCRSSRIPGPAAERRQGSGAAVPVTARRHSLLAQAKRCRAVATPDSAGGAEDKDCDDSKRLKLAAISALQEAAAAARLAFPEKAAQLDAGLPALGVQKRKQSFNARARCGSAGRIAKAFDNLLEAAVAADMWQLALHSGTSRHHDSRLNFPATCYTPRQVAAWAAWLLAKKPGLQGKLAVEPPCASTLVAAEQAGIAAVAEALPAVQWAAPELAQGMLCGTAKALNTSCNGGSRLVLTGRRPGPGFGFEDPLAAACAADLLELTASAVPRPDSCLNFPAATYTGPQLEAWAALIRARQPMAQQPATQLRAPAAPLAAAEGSGVVDQQQDAAAARKEAAEAAAAAAAIAVLQSTPEQAAAFRGDLAPPRGSWVTRLAGKRWVLRIRDTTLGGKALYHTFPSCLECACAADLALLATDWAATSRTGKPPRALNLPAAGYTEQQVAAWKEFLDGR